jgi:Domain of unknown function (DUF4863)
MGPEELRVRVRAVTDPIAGLALDGALERRLNASFPPSSAAFRDLAEACRAGIEGGWLCGQGGGKRRFGRVFEPAADLAGFSVDVVEIDDLVGNHHLHPTGEIDLIMPITPSAKFDGRGAGWLVYPPGSGHRPTVTEGKAVVLYLLPQGRIEWTTAY